MDDIVVAPKLSLHNMHYWNRTHLTRNFSEPPYMSNYLCTAQALHFLYILINKNVGYETALIMKL